MSCFQPIGYELGARKEAMAKLQRLAGRQNPQVVTVRTVQLVTPEGRPIRKATQVQIGSRKVTFTERFSKRLAIQQAISLLAKGYRE